MNDLYFKMNGRAFEGGYRLDKVAAGLNGLQEIFDGTYKAATGRIRITPKERKTFHLKATQFKEGSFLTYFGAVYVAAQTLPHITALGPNEIWELTKISFELLTELFTAAHQGKNPKIENNANGTAIIYEGQVQNHYHSPVYNIAISTIKGIRDLDDVLETGEVSSIELGKDDKKGIELKVGQKGLFRAPMIVDKDPHEILCDIFDFNKYDKTGKIRVYPGQLIEPGNYRFKVIGGQKIEDFILSMTVTKVTINCLVEYEQDPLSKTKIGSLLIVDIAT